MAAPLTWTPCARVRRGTRRPISRYLLAAVWPASPDVSQLHRMPSTAGRCSPSLSLSPAPSLQMRFIKPIRLRPPAPKALVQGVKTERYPPTLARPATEGGVICARARFSVCRFQTSPGLPLRLAGELHRLWYLSSNHDPGWPALSPWVNGTLMPG